jgi:nucleoside 2-deoxyribosyltransferase
MKVYIAAPFFNEEQLTAVGLTEFFLGVSKIDFFSPRSEGVLKDMSVEDQKKNRKAVFDSNIHHMNECTHMVALVSTKDTGTIFEMGYFCAQGKPILMYSRDLKSVNVMLGQAAFGVTNKIDEIPAVLLGILPSKKIESWT